MKTSLEQLTSVGRVISVLLLLVITVTTQALQVRGFEMAQASSDITIQISARVRGIDDPHNLLGGALTGGSIISGTYTYNSEAVDTDSRINRGQYNYSSVPYGFSLSSGELKFESNPENVNFFIGIWDNFDFYDTYLVRSFDNRPLTNGTLVHSISWQLDDPSMSVLSSDALPTTPPDLSKWQSIFGLQINVYITEPQQVNVWIFADVTSAELVSTTPTNTPTNTPVAPTSTPTLVPPTNIPLPATFTPTRTPLPPTNTPTKTSVPATNTSLPATATPTRSPIPPTSTSTRTPLAPTNTPLPATPTRTPVLSTATASNTPIPLTATPAAGKAMLTIVKDSHPDSVQDFTLYGPFGSFKLDDAAPEDNDGINRSITYSNLIPGTHQISEASYPSWYLASVNCSSTKGSTTSLLNRTLTVNALAGDNIMCTFVNQRRVNIQVFAFNDVNANRSREAPEPYQLGWEIALYSAANVRLQRAATDGNGLVTFVNRPPGVYKVCETLQNSWRTSIPSLIDASLNLPCYQIALDPGQNATLAFGNTQAANVIARSAEDDAISVQISSSEDINEEPELDEESAAGGQTYLPLVIR